MSDKDINLINQKYKISLDQEACSELYKTVALLYNHESRSIKSLSCVNKGMHSIIKKDIYLKDKIECTESGQIPLYFFTHYLINHVIQKTPRLGE